MILSDYRTCLLQKRKQQRRLPCDLPRIPNPNGLGLVPQLTGRAAAVLTLPPMYEPEELRAFAADLSSLQLHARPPLRSHVPRAPSLGWSTGCQPP